MDKTGYMHIPYKGGFVTAAIRVTGSVAKVGLSFCSPRDQFSRKKGRYIATGRLDAGKFSLTPLHKEERTKKQVLEHIIRRINKGTLGPRWCT